MKCTSCKGTRHTEEDTKHIPWLFEVTGSPHIQLYQHFDHIDSKKQVVKNWYVKRYRRTKKPRKKVNTTHTHTHNMKLHVPLLTGHRPRSVNAYENGVDKDDGGDSEVKSTRILNGEEIPAEGFGLSQCTRRQTAKCRNKVFNNGARGMKEIEYSTSFLRVWRSTTRAKNEEDNFCLTSLPRCRLYPRTRCYNSLLQNKRFFSCLLYPHRQQDCDWRA